MEYLTVPELSKITTIPDSTIRRYLESFKIFFRPKYFGSLIKYPEDSIIVLKTIYKLYKDGKRCDEIKEILRQDHNVTIEVKENNTLTTPELINLLIDRQENNIRQLKDDIVNVIPQLVDRLVQERLAQMLPQIIEDSIEKKVVPVLEYIEEKNHKKSFLSRFWGRGS